MSLHAERKSEVDTKLARLRECLAARHIDAIILSMNANTAWITAGAAMYVNEASDSSASSILVTMDRAYVLTDTIETPRLQQEEGLADLGFEFVVEPWYAPGKQVASLVTGKRIGQDGAGDGVDMSADLQHLRSIMQPEEVVRLRRASRLAAEIMQEVIRSVRPGISEYEIAARLSAASRLRGGNAVVNLVASDERIYQYRHPLPSNKTVERYAMLVLCLRSEGLIPAITRLVHFGPLPEELRAKAMAVAHVDATLILGTRAGRTMGDMFALAGQAYQEEGYPGAIEEHHQGGTLGYMPREIVAQPGNKTRIEQYQAFGWNPSLRGVKSEDTVLLGPNGPEILTEIADWPTWTITVNGQSIARPAILEDHSGAM